MHENLSNLLSTKYNALRNYHVCTFSVMDCQWSCNACFYYLSSFVIVGQKAIVYENTEVNPSLWQIPCMESVNIFTMVAKVINV